MSAEQPVKIEVTLEPDVAWQLAQFVKRLSFASCYELTEAHLPKDERTALAYKMIRGTDLIAAALRDAGVAPR